MLPVSFGTVGKFRRKKTFAGDRIHRFEWILKKLKTSLYIYAYTLRNAVFPTLFVAEIVIVCDDCGLECIRPWLSTYKCFNPTLVLATRGGLACSLGLMFVLNSAGNNL